MQARQTNLVGLKQLDGGTYGKGSYPQRGSMAVRGSGILESAGEVPVFGSPSQVPNAPTVQARGPVFNGSPRCAPDRARFAAGSMEAGWFRSGSDGGLTGEVPLMVCLSACGQDIANRFKQPVMLGSGHPFERCQLHSFLGLPVRAGGSPRSCTHH